MGKTFGVLATRLTARREARCATMPAAPHGKAVWGSRRVRGCGQAQGLTALKELSARKVALSWKGSMRSS